MLDAFNTPAQELKVSKSQEHFSMITTDFEEGKKKNIYLSRQTKMNATLIKDSMFDCLCI